MARVQFLNVKFPHASISRSTEDVSGRLFGAPDVKHVSPVVLRTHNDESRPELWEITYLSEDNSRLAYIQHADSGRWTFVEKGVRDEFVLATPDVMKRSQWRIKSLDGKVTTIHLKDDEQLVWGVVDDAPKTKVRLSVKETNLHNQWKVIVHVA